jgi:hypothetical protein
MMRASSLYDRRPKARILRILRERGANVMPTRPACVAILFFWVYASVGLLRRDILPDLWHTPPPDLRSIAAAEENVRPTEWELSVAEDDGLRNLRSVGRAVTRSNRLPDGGMEMVGHVWFDSGSLLKGTWFKAHGNETIDISNRMEVDPSGNLRRFRAVVRSASDDLDLVTLDGQVKDRVMEVKSRSSLPTDLLKRSPLTSALLNRTMSFPYEPQGMIQNSVGPIDRMPGLQVGQRWVSRVINPWTGRVEDVKVEVTGKHTIHWENTMVSTLVVVHHMTPVVGPAISARTWVRKDGLVLRQEVPFFFVKLVLERLPDRGERGQAGVKAP